MAFQAAAKITRAVCRAIIGPSSVAMTRIRHLPPPNWHPPNRQNPHARRAAIERSARDGDAQNDIA
jgi:hypothetical protein